MYTLPVQEKHGTICLSIVHIGRYNLHLKGFLRVDTDVVFGILALGSWIYKLDRAVIDIILAACTPTSTITIMVCGCGLRRILQTVLILEYLNPIASLVRNWHFE